MTEFIAAKAVLIYPEFDTQDTFWSYAGSLEFYESRNRFGLPKRLLPPLGLLGLYKYLKPFYRDIQLFDKNVDPRPLQELIADADHVYMGGMSAQQESLFRDAEVAKRAGKTLIVGGTAVSPDSPLVNVADHLIENEAEMVIDDLLQGLADGSAKAYYRGGAAPPERFFQPDFSAIDLRDYAHMALQISRGCPEACEFCDIPSRFGKNYRVTPWEKSAESFRQLTELGWRGPVFIVDDNFIGNPRKTLEALKQLYRIGEELGIHHPKYTELTLRFADDTAIMNEVRKWFRRCNFTQSFYGVETPNKASLRETDKQQNLRGDKGLVEKLAYISEQTGSGVMMGMIYGFDHDTDETADEFIEFVNATHAPVVMAGLLNALSQTGLMRRLKKEGRFIQFSSGNNSDGVINFIPMHFSIRQAERNYIRILQAIYRPEAYFKRVMRHLQLFDPSLKSEFRTVSEQLSAVFKILTRQNALIYWRYLRDALTVAGARFGFGWAGYKGVLAEYLALCAQYTHFIGQTYALQRQVGDRQYQSWQQFSWRQLLDAEINTVEVLEAHPVSSLLDTVRVQLELDYTVSGSRLQIMDYFSEQCVRNSMKKIIESQPTELRFLEIQIEAYREVCRRRPEILASNDWQEWENDLTTILAQNPDFERQMRQRYRKVKALKECSDDG